jgi:hypothetical protein
VNVQTLAHRRLDRYPVAKMIGAMVLALAPLVAALLLTGPSAIGPRAASAATATPGWEPDPNSVGSITFTNASGAVISTGSLTAPMGAFVIASHAGRSGVDTKATLIGATPKSGVDSQLWATEQLSSSTTYSPTPAGMPAALGSTGLPVVTSSAGDETLAQYISDFPNTSAVAGYQNLYQIRLYTSGTSASGAMFDSTDVVVDTTAQTWTVVYPTNYGTLPTPSSSPSPSPSPTQSHSPSPSPRPTPSHSPSPSPSPTPSPSPSPTPTPSPTASPSPTPSTSSGAVVATDASGTQLASDPSLVAGDSVTLQVAGFTASETVGVTLHSTPQTLSPVTASGTGAISYQFTVGSDLPAGAHTLVFLGATSGKSQTWAFTVGTVSATSADPAATASTSLPFTGSDSGRTLIIGIAALWSGLVLLMVSRPRPVLVVAGGGRHRSQPMSSGRHGGRHRGAHRV